MKAADSWTKVCEVVAVSLSSGDGIIAAGERSPRVEGLRVVDGGV